MPVRLDDYIQSKKQEEANIASNNNPTKDYFSDMSLIDIPIKLGASLFDLQEEIWTGASKSIEGIVDFGIGGVGALAGLFGNDNLENQLKQAAQYDFTGNTISKMDDFAEEQSIFSLDNTITNTVKQVAGGIGGMLPSILVTVATGGAGAGTLVQQAAGMGTFALGAAGMSEEQALNEGAELGQAFVYGAASGATEATIEYVSNKLFGGINPATGQGLSKIFSKGAGETVKAFISEGGEEVVADLADSVLKSITYSGKYETPELKELVNSFTVGGLTALAMGGANTAIGNIKNTTEGNRILNTVQSIEELNAQETELELRGKLTPELQKQYAEKRVELTKELGDSIKKIEDEYTGFKKDKAQGVIDALGGKESLLKSDKFNAQMSAAKIVLDDNNERQGTNYELEVRSAAENTKGLNGYIDRKNNKVVIYENAKNPVAVVLSHELTHTLEKSQLYKDLSDSVLKNMSAEELAQMRQELREIEVYKNDTDAMLDQEIVANFISENITNNSKTLSEVFGAKPSVLTRMLNFVKNKIKSFKSGSEEYNQYKEIKDNIQKALDSIRKDTTSTTTEKGERYSANIDDDVFSDEELLELEEELLLDEEGLTDYDKRQLKQLMSYFDDNILEEEIIEYKEKRTRKETKEQIDRRIAKSVATRKGNRIKPIALKALNEYELGTKKVSFKKETLDILYDYYETTDPNYHRVYVAKISPSDFLKLSLPAEYYEEFLTEVQGKDFDKEKFIKESPLRRENGGYNAEGIKLIIDMRKNRVLDHQGRHRMYALMENGYDYIPIIIEPSDEYFKYDNDHDGDTFEVTPQEYFGFFRGMKGVSIGSGLLREVYALNNANKEAIYANYTDEDADIRYSASKNAVSKATGEEILYFNNGEEVSKEVSEFVKNNNRFLFEDGDVKVLYHGSDAAGFMEFNSDIIFLSDNYENAGAYTRTNNLVVTRRFKSADELIDAYYGQELDIQSDRPIDIFEGSYSDALQDRIEQIKNFIKNNPESKDRMEQLLEILNEVKEKGYVVEKDGEIIGQYRNEKELIQNFLIDVQQNINLDEMVDEESDYYDLDEEPKTNNVYAGYVKMEHPLVINCRGNNFLNVPYKGKLMRTDDVALDVKASGEYDGVIFKNIVDNGERDMFNSLGTTDVFVIFSPNQFKALDNTNPTEDGDIRYSAKKKYDPTKVEGQVQFDLFGDDYIKRDTKNITLKPEDVKETKVEVKEEAKPKTVEQTIEETRVKVNPTIPEKDKSFGEMIRQAKPRSIMQRIKDAINGTDPTTNKLRDELTDSFASVKGEMRKTIIEREMANYKTRQEAIQIANQEIAKFEWDLNRAWTAYASANYMIGNELQTIWQPYIDGGVEYQELAQLYLLHRLNIKRMEFKYLDPSIKAELEQQLKDGEIDQETFDMIVEEQTEIIEKPIFDSSVTADDSRNVVEQLEKEHPEFLELHKQIAKYNNKLMRLRINHGLVSQKQVDFMKEHYGDDYVPTYREGEANANINGVAIKGAIGVTKGIYAAKGSSKPIQSIIVSMADQTMGVHKQAHTNTVLNDIYNLIPEQFGEQQSIGRITREDINAQIEPKTNQIYFYIGGEKVTFVANDTLAKSIRDLRNYRGDLENSTIGKVSSKAVSAFKKITTEYNPLFIVRNFFRDFSDFVITSPYVKNPFKEYLDAAKEMRAYSKDYKLYLANGGEGFSFYDPKTGFNLKEKKGQTKNIFKKISSAGEFIEQVPRFATFQASLKASEADIKAGKMTREEAINKAMYDAANVTVNFARGGTTTKVFNRVLMPYLNASVQGWCKTYKTFVHPQSIQAWGMCITKALIMALPAIVVNELIFGDDEDYEELSDNVKSSYYLWKVSDNKFIKIPRGRIESIFGDAIQRGMRYAKGDEEAFNTYLETTLSNVSPIDNLGRTVWSPFTDIKTNTNFYGGQIENTHLQKLPVSERYDEKTSEIAKFLSKFTPNMVSPKKWHYLLDQYSGFLGDLILPLTTKTPNIGATIESVSGLTVNSLNSNKYVTKYYDLKKELEGNNSMDSANGVDKAMLKYFNAMNTKVNDIYEEYNSATDKETKEAAKILMVQLQRDTVNAIKTMKPIFEKNTTGLDDEELFSEYYREAIREGSGAEAAIMVYSDTLYEKSAALSKTGLSWDKIYTSYFDLNDISPDYDKQGNAINGSKKNKIVKAMKTMGLNPTQKYMLMGMLGYKNVNGYSNVKSALTRVGYSQDEVAVLMSKYYGYDIEITRSQLNQLNSLTQEQKQRIYKKINTKTFRYLSAAEASKLIEELKSEGILK